MSFHPEMEYAPAKFHRSERKLAEPGEPFRYTPENQAKFDDIVTRYPADQRKSAILYALYLVQNQQGYITAAACATWRSRSAARRPKSKTSCRTTRCSTRGRSAGSSCNVCRTLSCALLGAERVTEELSEKLGIKPGETDRPACSR